MRSRLVAALAIVGALVIGSGCHRRSAPAQPEPQTQAPAPAPAPSAPLSAGAPDVAALVARVRPSVVNITAVHEVTVRSREHNWPFGIFPGLPGGRDHTLRERSLGSGFVIDQEGHVITNAHVVDEADVVQVKLADGRDFRARIVGKDEAMDVAIVQLEHAPGDLPVASLGSSDALRAGDYVVAIGNPFGLGDTVTMGIVSATERALGAGPYDDFIQTDASINPGNSGGPLFDVDGQVVGISTAIVAQAQGIGFAIPIDDVKRVLPQLMAGAPVARGRIGVTVQGMDSALAKALGLDRPRGALVADVQPGGPAAKAGVQPRDVILAVAGHDVSRAADLPRLVAEHAPGSRVALTVLRDKQSRDVEVTVSAARPPEGVASKQATTPKAARAAPSAPLGFVAGSARGGGAVVETVTPGGPADGKLAPGDVVESLNSERVAGAADLAAKAKAAPADEPVLLRVRHGRQPRYVAIERP